MAAKKTKQKHLGKGLQALLGPIGDSNMLNESQVEDSIEMPIDEKLSQGLRYVSINDITPNPYQPRKVWNEDELTELVESIRANGVIQPIIVRKTADGYQLIAGERRWRASNIAELDKIPAIVRQASDSEMLELALVENIHRADLNPVERASAYKDYIEKFELTQAQASERLGENRSVIANFMRLLELPSEIKDMLTSKELSMGHARAILALPSDDLRRKLANRALAGRLSVREVERLVKLYLAGKVADQPAEKPEKASYIEDLERKLRDELGTKVQIVTRKGGKKGRIVIDFYSLDEFDRLTEKMGISMVDGD